jgi:hypothetical protein
MCDHVQAGTAVPKTKSFASCSSASHRQGCDDRIDRVRAEPRAGDGLDRSQVPMLVTIT